MGNTEDKNQVEEKGFGEVMTSIAKHKSETMTDDEYNDWLDKLSLEFASMFY